MSSVFFSNCLFVVAALLTFLSLTVFLKTRKIVFSLLLLFSASFILGIFMAQLDPFINIWDERFHALVAKNFMDNPFEPILVEQPLFGFEKANWAYCKIWLHKQPLFLWQIALSLNVFGLTEIGVRFPSILMHSVMILFVYRIGKICLSAEVGYFSALFFSFAYYPLEYITGFYSTDHNDTAFMFYSFGSIWALIEYYESNNLRYVFFVGLLAGAAVLCKWLPGLLVYGIWSVTLLNDFRIRKDPKQLLAFFSSLIVSILLFLPWQIYTLVRFPIEFKNAMDFNFKHIREPLEGHGGNYSYYYNALFEQFGEGTLVPIIVIMTFIIMIIKLKHIQHKIIFSLALLFTYTFFTLVKTKMHGYVFVTFPFLLIGITYSFHSVVKAVGSFVDRNIFKETLTFSCALLLVFFVFNGNKIIRHHTEKEKGRLLSRNLLIREKEVYSSIRDKYGDGKYLLFNCSRPNSSHILAIFYTNFPSFNYILPEYQIREAKDLKYKLIAIDHANLPNYVLEDKDIIKISF